MKQQFLRLFSFILGIAFIASGVIFTVVTSYKDDRNKMIEEQEKIADEIGDVYKVFFDMETNLSAYRDEVMKDFANYVTFYSDMPKGYQGIMEKIGEYDNKITEIEDAASYLEAKCVDKYSVLEANDKCIAYYLNRERTINTFVGDTEYFNSKIKEFNDWTEVENASVLATVKYEKLEEYVSEKHSKYVDLNNDGTFLGQNAD